MPATDTTETVRAAVAPVVAALGCVVYDVELAGSGKGRTLRVMIDRARGDRDGGVDLDTIAEATRAISPVLDARADMAGPYLLEVSSPGVERPLRTPEHYRGAIGSEVSVKHRTHGDASGGGVARARGRLVDANDHDVTIDQDGARLTIAYGDITSARTVFEWGPQTREKPRARAKGVKAT